MKKALIIGSEGNIGKPLVKHLKSKGYDIMESDIKPAWRENYIVADINHPIDLVPAFDWKPDVVFLLSAMVSRVTCEQSAGQAIATNLVGVNNVLQFCKRANAMTVFFSTSEIYGPQCEVMDESLSDPKPNNRYGLSKLLGEKLVEYEVEHYNLKAVSLRPFMMYDENEDLGNHRSAMIRFAYNLAHGLPIEVHKGSARGWLHVSDAVEAIERAAHVKEYSVINIGQGDIRPIHELAEMIRERLGASKDLVKTIEIPGQMTLVKNPTLDRMRDTLGHEAKVSLEEGVDRMCTRILERIKEIGSPG
ncbi:MAG: NAD(P)-dependent oxidoreductase [Rhizobiaceae bacterium]|nr:NAD(P)-dependent oxidoreductase [Rhizobiaceae bacterium]